MHESYLKGPGCPLCNGLISLIQVCPTCHRALIDGGRVEDYLSPYDPYEEVEENLDENLKGSLEGILEEEDTCTHLIFCPSCSQDWRVKVG